MPGWTLALDIPAATPGLAPLLDGLDELVAERRRPRLPVEGLAAATGALAAMYPQLERWRELQRGVDPDGMMRSDLSRSLGLLGPTE